MAESEEQRIKELEQSLTPFAKIGGGFQQSREDSSVALMTLRGFVTVGDFRRAAAVLNSTGAQDG